MSNQPEALRLADDIAEMLPKYVTEPIAAELRRLHEENGRLRIVAEMSTLLLDQRDASYEALRYIADHDLRDVDLSICGHIAHALVGKARDAIKAIEGEKE